MHKIALRKELSGSILDVGGGGEGIIGRIYREQVTAIDRRQEELDEAPPGFRKLCMDACDLRFPEDSFDHATFFYTMMYIPKSDHLTALREARRVLRPGGLLHIWDADIRSAWPEPFLAGLEIDAAGTPVSTTYGVVKEDAAQNAGWFTALCEEAGFAPVRAEEDSGHFYLCFRAEK